MRAIVSDPSQHELTDSYRKFLTRKADEIDPPDSQIPDPLAPANAQGKKKFLDLNDPVQAKLVASMRAQGLLPPEGANSTRSS